MSDPMPATFEGLQLAAITFDEAQALITIERMPDKPGIAARIFRKIADEGISVDLVVQNANPEKTFTDLSFSVAAVDAERTRDLTVGLLQNIGGDIRLDREVAKVSIEGMGMRTHSMFAASMFETLGKAGVNIALISTSEMKISCVIRRDSLATAIGALSEALRLSITREEVPHRDGPGEGEILGV